MAHLCLLLLAALLLAVLLVLDLLVLDLLVLDLLLPVLLELALLLPVLLELALLLPVLLDLALLLPVLLELALLLPVLLDLALLLPVLPTLLDPDTRMEELAASPRQEPALLASSARRGPLPITITAMSDGLEAIEALAVMHSSSVFFELFQFFKPISTLVAAVVHALGYISVLGPLMVSYWRIVGML